MGSGSSTQESKRPRRRRGGKRRARPNLDLRKAMFVLPNLFTVSSIFCGFYAIVLTSGDPKPETMYLAALAVFFGTFFDMADGRVARLTRTQSDFGVQLDSLADLVTFGVAPAVIVHKWGLDGMGLLGTIVAFTYVAAGAIRLARFNVLAARSRGGAMDHFIGLPIPLAAGLLVSLVMFHQRVFARPAVREVNILLLVLVLSYLMVSNVRYRSFKKVRASRTSLSIGIAVVFFFAIVGAQVHPTFAVLTFFGGYVGLGLLEEVIFYRKRRRALATQGATDATVDDSAPPGDSVATPGKP